MKKDRWSDYAKYLVLSDNSDSKLKGTFGHYQDFKTIREVINSIAFSDKNTYLHNNNIYFKIIYNGSPNRFISEIKIKGIEINTQNQIWEVE